MIKRVHIATLIAGTAFLASLFYNSYLFNYSGEASYYIVPLILSISGFILYLFLGLSHRSTGKLLMADLCLICFMLVCVFSEVNRGQEHLANESLLILLTLFAAYGMVRTGGILFPERLGDWVSIAFLLECCLCTYQIFQPGVDPLSIRCKGSFDNSGMLANFIVVSCPFLLYRINLLRYKVIWPYVVMLYLLAVVATILITQARTAFLALMVVLLILLMRFRGKPLVLRNTGKWLVLGLLSVFLGAVTIKRGSTAGRLLIWQVSSEHLADKPLTGFGYASFPSVYPGWQANYFESGKGTQEFRQDADNVGIAFNEYLNIYLETGVAGLTAFFGILLSFRRQKVSAENSERAFYIKLSLGTLLLLSLFSYPMQNTTILLVAILGAGFLSNMAEGGRKVRISPPIRSAAYLIAAGLSLAGGCYFIHRSRDLRLWNTARERIMAGDTTALTAYGTLYPDLYHNAAFVADYGQALYDAGHFVECCSVLQRATINSIETENLNLLGLSYQALKRYKASEACFRTNANLVPGTLYPKYRLVKLYLETKDTASAIALADTILHMPVKVHSDKTFEIQTEMSRLCSSSAENKE